MSTVSGEVGQGGVIQVVFEHVLHGEVCIPHKCACGPRSGFQECLVALNLLERMAQLLIPAVEEAPSAGMLWVGVLGEDEDVGALWVGEDLMEQVFRRGDLQGLGSDKVEAPVAVLERSLDGCP